MSVIARFPSIGIQTNTQLRQAQRRLDRQQAEAARVLAAMKAGAALHLHYQNGRAIWSLSSGQFVPADVANITITKSEIVGVGDTLFPCALSQTWRYCDDREA